MENEVEWIQCIQCDTWLQLPKGMNPEDFDQDWTCNMYPNNGTCTMKSNISLYDVPYKEDNELVLKINKKTRRIIGW
jgi:hypothetical protein